MRGSTMVQKFLNLVKRRARLAPARIVFPETFDERILRAISKIEKEKTALPILIDMKHDKKRRNLYAKKLFELRKEKGLTLKEAQKLMSNYNYLGVMAVKMGDADGMISGACSSTADTLRPALQIIKTKERFHKVSGFFFMVLENRLLLFADCAVNIEPDAHGLADIAIDTAQTAKRFGITPRIALLSFSTNGSTKHPSVDRVKEAVKIVNYRRPDLICEGEMQVDAALNPEICARKFPLSRVPGNANVLIFPDLDSANISYKLVQKLAGAQAIGPIIQGLQKPINDLSRGCSVDDIVNLAAITSVEAQEIKNKSLCIF
ncbi:phosphate acetyltransferase [Candidatus Peregrinibacteria bacterium]|nr:phosphate acetyltransferase [Candidatus Peregrinibacteria bacterium]